MPRKQSKPQSSGPLEGTWGVASTRPFRPWRPLVRSGTERRGAFWHFAANRGVDARDNKLARQNTHYFRSSAPFRSTYSSTYLRTFDRTLSVNAKSEDREACFATSALASFGPNRAMASDEMRPRSKCNPKKDATARFISRAKEASVGGGGARGCGGGCGAGGDGVAAGGAATVSAAQASGAFIDDDADDCTGNEGRLGRSATRCSTRTGGGPPVRPLLHNRRRRRLATGLRLAARLAASATASAGATWPLSKASSHRFFARHSANLSTQAPRNEAGQAVQTRDSKAAATFVAEACFEPPNAANNK